MDLIDLLVLAGAITGMTLGAAGAWLLRGRAGRNRRLARQECHRSDLAQREAQIAAVRGALRARKRDLLEANEEIARLRANLDAVQRAIQRQGGDIVRLNREMDEAARASDGHLTTIRTLEHEVRRRDAEVAELFGAIRIRDTKIDSLETSLTNRPVIVSRRVG